MKPTGLDRLFRSAAQATTAPANALWFRYARRGNVRSGDGRTTDLSRFLRRAGDRLRRPVIAGAAYRRIATKRVASVLTNEYAMRTRPSDGFSQ
jgi:hypothetical protein